MNQNQSLFISIISLVMLMLPIHGMDIVQSIDPFESCVTAIENCCKQNCINKSGLLALMEITAKNNIADYTSAPAYQKLQQLDLSNIIPQLEQIPFLSQPLYSDQLQNLTIFMAIQGRLSKHISSVILTPKQLANPPQNDYFSPLWRAAEFKFKAKICQIIPGAESLYQTYNILADIMEQKHCLITNTTNKKNSIDNTEKEKNHKPLIEVLPEIKIHHTPQILTNNLDTTEKIEIQQSLATQTATATYTDKSKEKPTVIKQKTKDENNNEPEDEPTIKMPFSKTFFINGIKLTLLVAVIYYLFQHRSFINIFA